MAGIAVGCGSGPLFAARRGRDAIMTGVDTTGAMLELARCHLPGNHHHTGSLADAGARRSGYTLGGFSSSGRSPSSKFPRRADETVAFCVQHR